MLTRQFLLQILVVFVAKLVLRDQCACLGITCDSHELPVLSILRESTYPCTIRKNHRSAAVLSWVTEGRVDIPASDVRHPIITMLASSQRPDYQASYPQTNSVQIAQRPQNRRHGGGRSIAVNVRRESRSFGDGFGSANFVLAPPTSIDCPKSPHPGKHASLCS